jgi:transcriptional regulator with XRE-family HTH domain
MTGNKLKKLRVFLGFSQTKLGSALGVAKRTIINYENAADGNIPVIARLQTDKLFMIRLNKLKRNFDQKTKEINDV